MAAALMILIATGVLLVRQVGHWLVVSDQLTPARAVVVFTGDFPFRAMEAATIYREGWVPEVWLQQSRAPAAREAVLKRLGMTMPREELANQALLERLGVPGPSIRVLSGRAGNTREEVDIVRRQLERVGGDVVVLVTSKAHSRRLRATWRWVAGDSARGIVRFARDDPFEPWTWWRSTADGLMVTREVLGLVNLWMGFPVSGPERR